jgi:exopolyphosphatase/guanosine-5'-triphosphate,3'-diphosphate pyrophosphatase
VAHAALHFYSQLMPVSAKHSDGGGADLQHRLKLEWAARLHEIGTPISHSDYHKHGAYILDNADAVGLDFSQLHRLSLLVLGHRGKLRKLEVDFSDEVFVQQLMSLRLAVIVCHARRDPQMATLKISMGKFKPGEFFLETLGDWTAAYPQSMHLLNAEVLAWQKTGWSLRLG